ncbi:MAG: tRNA epoxyqueuosine(34) reductase QueG [Aeoliella sp.]
MNAAKLTNWLKKRALEAGFSSIGIAPAVSPPGALRLSDWLEAGYAGEMHYLADRRDAYDHPLNVLDGVRSLVMLTLDYRTADPVPTKPGQGRVSRYAWGEEDYHDLIHYRLKPLAADLSEQASDARVRGVVDTAPLMEREFAQMAGLGWIGKHTLLLNQSQGSWFFLAALLTDAELHYDAEPFLDHCGTCTACLDVCPTGAFPQPYVLDATKCISYLTIEHKSAIPTDLRPGMGDWLFGCDLCQEVCPWNNRAPESSEPSFLPKPETNPLDLASLFSLTDEEFRRRFRHTPLWRPKRRGLLRNAAIVLGNWVAPQALPALILGLNDEEPLVRGASAWALGQYATTESQLALRERLMREELVEIQREIELALA